MTSTQIGSKPYFVLFARQGNPAVFQLLEEQILSLSAPKVPDSLPYMACHEQKLRLQRLNAKCCLYRLDDEIHTALKADKMEDATWPPIVELSVEQQQLLQRTVAAANEMLQPPPPGLEPEDWDESERQRRSK